LRPSFLDEILENETHVLMRHQYSNWIFTHRELNLASSGTPGQERVIICMPVFVAFGLKASYQKRILLLTTLGFYFIDSSRKCGICIDSCFGIPVICARFSFEEIGCMVYFSHIRQQLLMSLTIDPSKFVPQQSQKDSSMFFWSSTQTAG
jgi:hypothetical protein